MCGTQKNIADANLYVKQAFYSLYNISSDFMLELKNVLCLTFSDWKEMVKLSEEAAH